MRGFLLGIIVALIVVFCGGYWWVSTGHVDSRAIPNGPSQFERGTANHALDEWVDAHAPKQDNPFKPTTENIMDGSMVYDKHCALCHGSLKEPVSPLKTKFYPPVPQLMNHTPDERHFNAATHEIEDCRAWQRGSRQIGGFCSAEFRPASLSIRSDVGYL